VQDGSFAAFVVRILKNEYTFENMTVTYVTDEKAFDLTYDTCFKVNGEEMDTDYARYESAYVQGAVERKAEVIRVSFDGALLELNYKEGSRVQK
jgi:hypothetical protein